MFQLPIYLFDALYFTNFYVYFIKKALLLKWPLFTSMNTFEQRSRSQMFYNKEELDPNA